MRTHATALVILLAASMAPVSCAPRADTSRDKDVLREEAVLGVQLMELADLGHGIMRDFYAHAVMERRMSSVQVAALARITAGVTTTMRSIAIAPSPHDGLVQMYIWCRVGGFASANRVRIAPDVAPDLTEPLYGRIRTALQPIAERHLKAQQLAALDAIIDRFERANPDLLSVSLMRLDDIAESRDAADLVLPDTTPDMLSPVTDAARQLELTRLLGVQGMWMLARTPDAVAMELDGATRMLLESEPVRRFSERAEGIERSLTSTGERMSSVAEGQQRIGDELRRLAGSVDGIAARAERMFGIGIGAALAVALVVAGWAVWGRKKVL